MKQEKVVYLYLCDQTKCQRCHDECKHTLDRAYSLNFKDHEPGEDHPDFDKEEYKHPETGEVLRVYYAERTK